MTPAAVPEETGRGNTAGAVRQLGERISSLEIGQAQIVGRLDAMAAQLTSACSDMRGLNKAIDDHETRLRLREQAYSERILPALERLHNLELKVAGGAVLGGAVITLITELIRAFVK